jgi:prepilin-type processing-associated H-X9-DG protein
MRETSVGKQEQRRATVRSGSQRLRPWARGALPALVAAAWAYLLQVVQYDPDPSLDTWALGGGLAAGILVSAALHIGCAGRCPRRWLLLVGAVLAPPLGGYALWVYYDRAVYASDPARFPDWFAVLLGGALAGAVAAAVAWVLLRCVSGAARAVTTVLVFAVAVWAPYGVAHWWVFGYPSWLDDDLSCPDNLELLGWAMLMYAEDYDGHLPPAVPFRDTLNSQGLEVVLDWRFVRDEGRGDGVLYPYVKNSGLWFCPRDWGWHDRLERWRPDYYPDPGVSYRWDVSLGGKSIGDVPDPESVPMIFDRAPFHEGCRNVAFADGHVGPIAEEEWGRLAVAGR